MTTPTPLPPQRGRPSRLYNIFNKETDELILANTTIHHALRTLRFTKASSSSNLRNTARYERYSCEGYYARFVPIEFVAVSASRCLGVSPSRLATNRKRWRSVLPPGRVVEEKPLETLQ